MATLSKLELKLKKLAVLSKAYADQAGASERVTMTESATTEGYLKTYTLLAGEGTAEAREIGKIDIPKDYLVKEAHVLTVEWDSTAQKFLVTRIDGVVQQNPQEAPSQCQANGQYIDFTINVMSGTSADSHIYVNMTSFIDNYEGGDGIEVSGTSDPTVRTIYIDLAAVSGLEFVNHKLAIKVETSTGLGLDANSGLTLELAQRPISGETQGNAGAMTAQDKEQLFDSTHDLLVNNELGSWFDFSTGETAEILSGVTDHTYDEP